MKKVFVLFLIVAIGFSCKKGEEDPAISFKSRKKRLTGKWEIKEYYLETLDLLDTNTFVYYSDYTLEFKKNGDFIESFKYFDENRTEFFANNVGVWDFENEGESFQTFFNSRVLEYSLTKLTDEEIKFVNYSNGLKREFRAEKI